VALPSSEARTYIRNGSNLCGVTVFPFLPLSILSIDMSDKSAGKIKFIRKLSVRGQIFNENISFIGLVIN